MTLRLHRAAVTLPQHLLPFDSKSATKLAKSPSSLSQQGMLKQDVLRREQQKRLPNRALSRIAWQSSFPSSSIANVQSDEEQGHTVCCCSGSVSQKCRYALANSRKPAICHWKQIHGKRSHKATRTRRMQHTTALRFTRRVQRPTAPSDACSIPPLHPDACSIPPCSAPSDARSIPPRPKRRSS